MKDEYKEMVCRVRFIDGVLARTYLSDVEIVRCKDCKYWLPHEQFGYDADNDEYHNYCERLVPDDDYYAFTREADEFCSRAVRKDNGAD